MNLRPPSAIDDFGNTPEENDLRQTFIKIWNDETKYMGEYAKADPRFPNYVDPRIDPPTTGAVPVPWNGFPKLLSRWFDDEASANGREEAEAAADVLVPKWSWLQPDGKGGLSVFSCAPHQVAYYASVLGAHVPQIARPRRFVNPDGTLGAELVEEYRQQDEYLEWFAKRDVQGRLVELHFTAEPPDYWHALAEVSKEKVLALYKKILGHSVPADEVFYAANVATAAIDTQGQVSWFVTSDKGKYNPLNVWTTRKGIIHLTHWANTLGAEVNLAKQASAVLQCDSLPQPPLSQPTAEVRRIACGNYGGINRSSDPLIGLGVGDHVGDGARITLTDPVGLYILKCNLDGLVNPDGKAIGSAVRTVARGDDHVAEPRMLRIELKAPVGVDYVLGDCSIDARRLERGGQVARQTTMGLYAQIYPDSANTNVSPCQAIPCRNPTRPNHFIDSGVEDNQHVCPVAGNMKWLVETPYVPTAGALGGAGGGAMFSTLESHLRGHVKTGAIQHLPPSRSPFGK